MNDKNKKPSDMTDLLNKVQDIVEQGQAGYGVPREYLTSSLEKQNQEFRRKQELYETAKKCRRERRSRLLRLSIISICVFVIIVSLLGMAAISYATSGRWYHQQPPSNQTSFPSLNQ